MDDPRPLGEVLDQVVRSLGAPSTKALRSVFSEWDDVVGEQVAAHARPLALDGGRLVVGVDEPGWATQLRYLEPELLAQLREALGEDAVTRIEVRVRHA